MLNKNYTMTLANASVVPIVQGVLILVSRDLEFRPYKKYVSGPWRRLCSVTIAANLSRLGTSVSL